MPVTRREFRRIKGRGDGWWKDNYKRQYSEYSEQNSKTQREDDRDNQWDVTSDGPDSTTSGSDIPEGHYDRPPEEEYSGVPTFGRPHLDMWQIDYVLQLDNWRKQWSGCSRT